MDPKSQPVGYKYRKWTINENVDLVCRIQIDGAVDPEKGGLLSIKCLNEVDPKVSGIDWKLKIDSSRVAILTNEYSNNSNKLAKWAMQALIAGIDCIKVGFVSRTNVRDPSKHVIVGVQSYLPSDLIKQLNLDVRNGWGIVKAFMGVFNGLEDGTYIICKDPDWSKPFIKLFRK